MSFCKIEEACGRYIEALDKQSPIVSTSHYYLRGLYDAYGKKRVDAELDRQFEEKAMKLTNISTTPNVDGSRAVNWRSHPQADWRPVGRLMPELPDSRQQPQNRWARKLVEAQRG